jgi:hypothetical protein
MLPYSIVDSFIYARPHVHRISSHEPEAMLFFYLCENTTKEQFNRLWEIYTQRGNQYTAMLEWARGEGIKIEVTTITENQ